MWQIFLNRFHTKSIGPSKLLESVRAVVNATVKQWLHPAQQIAYQQRCQHITFQQLPNKNRQDNIHPRKFIKSKESRNSDISTKGHSEVHQCINVFWVYHISIATLTEGNSLPYSSFATTNRMTSSFAEPKRLSKRHPKINGAQAKHMKKPKNAGFLRSEKKDARFFSSSNPRGSEKTGCLTWSWHWRCGCRCGQWCGQWCCHWCHRCRHGRHWRWQPSPGRCFKDKKRNIQEHWQFESFSFSGLTKTTPKQKTWKKHGFCNQDVKFPFFFQWSRYKTLTNSCELESVVPHSLCRKRICCISWRWHKDGTSLARVASIILSWLCRKNQGCICIHSRTPTTKN